MFGQVARRLASWPVVSRPSAAILERVGQRYLARRIAYKGGQGVPEVISEPFFTGQISMLSCAGRDQVARRLWMRGWQHFEAPLPFVFAHLAKRSTHILDVGANTGFYSLIAGLANPRATVHAFEPVPSIASLADRNLALNDVRNVVVHQKAVGDTNGRMTMYLPIDDHGLIETSASLSSTFRSEHSAEIETEVVTLDQLIHDADLIKVDVESLEALVLAGARGLIRRCQPVLTLEILASDLRLETIVKELSYTPVAMSTQNVFEVLRDFGPRPSSPNQLLWPTSKLQSLALFAKEIGFNVI